ncbi:MAG: transposase family protein [bacterium]|nr:MAG: transposase family protein [bacterium]
MAEHTKGGDLLTVGVDLGDEWSRYCRLDTSGEVAEEGRVRTTEDALQKMFARLPRSVVAMETGTHSPWVERVVKTCGHEAIVANPRRLRLIYQSTNKTDRLDAQALARLARTDRRLLYPIRHRGEEAQADLSVLRARGALVEARTKLVNAVRGMLKSFGKRVKKCDTGVFAEKAAEAVPKAMKPAIDPLLETIKTLSEKIAAYDNTVETAGHSKYPETMVLRQVAGVGPVTALTYVLTLEDPSRFRTSRSVGAFLGLTARRAQSSGEDPQLRITKAGDPTLRRLLVGSAQYILGPFGPDTDLRRWGLKLAERGAKNQKKRAVVAVARKLAVLLHRLWMTHEDYEPLRNAARTKTPKKEDTAKETTRSETYVLKEG